MSRWRNYWQYWRRENQHPKYTFGGDTRPATPVLKDRRFVSVNTQTPLIYDPIGEIKGSLYLGTGAGKHLLGDIEGANHSVKIVSPYISDNLLNILLKKSCTTNCAISLVTIEGNSSARDPIGQEGLIKGAVKQNVQTDEVALNRKQKRMNITSNLLLVLITLLVTGMFFSLYFWRSIIMVP